MCAVDADGRTLLSVKVPNDEVDIVSVIATVRELASEAVWAVDIIGVPSALLLALLAHAGQSMRYAPGRVVAAMSSVYTGEGKTDVKDAYVIAETAHLRRDLAVIGPEADNVRDLAVLTGHRADLIADRVRMINRLRESAWVCRRLAGLVFRRSVVRAGFRRVHHGTRGDRDAVRAVERRTRVRVAPVSVWVMPRSHQRARGGAGVRTRPV